MGLPPGPDRPATIGILSAEVAGAMAKAVHLHRSLSPQALSRLETDVLRSPAVRNLVSADETQLVALVAAEKLEQLTRVAAAVTRLGRRCSDPALAGFDHVFSDLLADRLNPATLGFLSDRAMRAAVKKMARLATSSLSSRTHLEIASLLARAVCTLLARLRHVFPGVTMSSPAPPSTVGGAALALHYSNLIIIIGKLLQYPHLVGEEARNDLYQMLPASLRAALRLRLRRCARELAIYDGHVAFEWRRRMEEVLTWLGPMARHMVTWQAERSFEKRRIPVPLSGVVLSQTLYFADREKTEAAICELLVGLNYVCRYEQQSALLRCDSSFDFDPDVDFHL